MSAPTHTRPCPATTGGVDTRLRWWALALPALTFVALLLLILNPSDAGAATGDLPVAHLFASIHRLLMGQ